MSVTLTANYKEVLAPATVEKIDELVDDCYELSDILEFIDEYNERSFVEYYEEYVRCGEAIGYNAVDALISEDGIDYIEGCDDRYRGVWESEADFAENFYADHDIPSAIVVDWDETYRESLSHDFTSCSDGYRSVHIFSDY